MTRPVKLGATCFINVDLVFSGGADFFESFRYEQRLENGGHEGVDISEWDAFMAFAKGNQLVLQCDECLSTDEDGFVHVHLTPDVTSQLPKGMYDYNIVLRDNNGAIISFVEGEATVSRIIPVIPDEEQEH